GIIAGIVSALSFIYLHPVFCKKLKALDVMGVHNLHGMAGWVGAFSGFILLLVHVGSSEAFTNLTAAVFVFVMTLVLGIVMGLILKVTRGSFPDEHMFSDDADFIKNEAPA
ncbi:MAG: ammonium transporter, partial [Methanomassiliicoccaceae archaeon]|nr:ammonium transporter [Methanomassiliicoccaceae archaeon]